MTNEEALQLKPGDRVRHENWDPEDFAIILDVCESVGDGSMIARYVAGGWDPCDRLVRS